MNIYTHSTKGRRCVRVVQFIAKCHRHATRFRQPASQSWAYNAVQCMCLEHVHPRLLIASTIYRSVDLCAQPSESTDIRKNRSAKPAHRRQRAAARNYVYRSPYQHSALIGDDATDVIWLYALISFSLFLALGHRTAARRRHQPHSVQR